MKRLILVSVSTLAIIVFALCFKSINQSNNAVAKVIENLPWSEYRILDWSDFQGAPDYNDNFVKALTASSIKYSYSCNGVYLDYDINAVFKKDQSWVKEEARTDYTLAHEQIHFDITELHVRRLKEKLNARIFYCDEVAKFESIVTSALEDWRAQQVQYDKETFYSVIEEKQQEWNYKISYALFGDKVSTDPNYVTQY